VAFAYVKLMTRPPQTPSTSGRCAPWAWGLRLRGPGLLGQGARYAVAGATVAAVYLGTTTALADVAGLPFQIALIIGFCVGLSAHFTLQRFFVWAHHEGYALPFNHQAARYLAVAGAQYGLTAASTSVLPAALGLPVEVVYFATVAALVSVNFLIFRNGVFHPKVPA
jgi:putative flippase GtrA